MEINRAFLVSRRNENVDVGRDDVTREDGNWPASSPTSERPEILRDGLT